MRVRKLDTTSKADQKAFIDLPYRLYRNHPLWVPPLKNDLKYAMDRERYPFYEHSTADFFIAEQDGEVVGRVCMADNHNYNTYKDCKVAYYYYFDCVEDQDVAKALFEAGFDWAHKRGLDTIRGPKGLVHADGLGMLVEGFDRQSGTGIAYNYPYYSEMMEALGFAPWADYLSGYLHSSWELPERVFALAERVKERRGLRVVAYDNKEEMRQWIPRIQQIYNSSFVDVPGFCPLTEAEINLIAERILSVARPELIKLVMKGDELVGFLFAYPNVSEGLRKAKGSMWPLGWLHLLRAFRNTKTVDLNGIGMLPKHQGVGGTAVLYVEIERTVRAFNFEHANFIQIYEHNIKSMGDPQKLGMEWVQRHRIWERKL